MDDSKIVLWSLKKLPVFLRKTDAEPEKGMNNYRAIALTSVMLCRSGVRSDNSSKGKRKK